MDRYEDDERQLEGDRRQTDDGVGSVLSGGLVDARRWLGVRSPEGVEHLALLATRTALIDIKLHEATLPIGFAIATQLFRNNWSKLHEIGPSESLLEVPWSHLGENATAEITQTQGQEAYAEGDQDRINDVEV